MNFANFLKLQSHKLENNLSIREVERVFKAFDQDGNVHVILFREKSMLISSGKSLMNSEKTFLRKKSRKSSLKQILMEMAISHLRIFMRSLLVEAHIDLILLFAYFTILLWFTNQTLIIYDKRIGRRTNFTGYRNISRSNRRTS